MYKKEIQDSEEYDRLSARIAEIGQTFTRNYVSDKLDFAHMLDEVDANVTKLRELLDLPKTDKPDDLDASPFLHNSDVTDKLLEAGQNGL